MVGELEVIVVIDELQRRGVIHKHLFAASSCKVDGGMVSVSVS